MNHILTGHMEDTRTLPSNSSSSLVPVQGKWRNWKKTRVAKGRKKEGRKKAPVCHIKETPKQP